MNKISSLNPGRLLCEGRPHLYRNLTRNCLSVRIGGRVAGHAQAIHAQHVRFVVSERGRQRVLASGKKQVHATVRLDSTIEVLTVGAAHTLSQSSDWRSVRYNPKVRGQFFLADTGQDIYNAEEVLIMVPDGKTRTTGMWVRGILVTGPVLV